MPETRGSSLEVSGELFSTHKVGDISFVKALRKIGKSIRSRVWRSGVQTGSGSSGSSGSSLAGSVRGMDGMENLEEVGMGSGVEGWGEEIEMGVLVGRTAE
jgi:hypothetical protein